MRKILVTIAFGVLGIGVQSQDIVDTAIQLGQSNYGGSARIQAIGGTQVSLGGDVSSIVSNPAGLGMFNRSVFSGSLGLNFLNSQSNYAGNTTLDSKANMNIPNLSIVIHKEINSRYTDFKNGSFGVSYNRINDFHRQDTYQGRSGTSMIDFFINRADGVDITDLIYKNSLEGLAADTYLIRPLQDFDSTAANDIYDSDILGSPLQTETIAIKGRQSQLSFSYGANYADLLFIGAGIGLTSIEYKSTKSYNERDFVYNNPEDPEYVNPLHEYTLKENLNITGSGVNATLGIMVRPVDFLQIGGSFTTPTYYNIDDKYDASISADNSTAEDTYAETDITISNYSVTTPSKLSAGVTLFLGKHGFLSADVERINYAKSKLRSDDFEVLGDNQYLSTSHRKGYNVKIGGEYRYDIFRFRGGFSNYENPVVGASQGRQVYSGGIGLRVKDYFVDLAIVHNKQDYTYTPYQLGNDTPQANVNQNSTLGVITFGVNF